MDKVIYLISKEFSKSVVDKLTQKDLEGWVSEDSYENDEYVIKIDANDYTSVEDALTEEGWDTNEYYVVPFGF